MKTLVLNKSAHSRNDINVDKITKGPFGSATIISRASINLFILLLFLPAFFGCARIAHYGLGWDLIYYEGNYYGKVIDAETLQPIEGAVVLGVWHKEYATVAGPVSEYYDARETVTDENGDFSIKGMGPRAVTHLEKMDFVVFKVGYEHLDRSSWEEIQKEKHILWENGKAIIPLSKLSLEQRKKRWVPYISGDVPMEKQKRFREEMKREIDDIHR